MQEELLSHLGRFIAFESVSTDPEKKGECVRWAEETFLSGTPLKRITGETDGSPYLYLAHPEQDLLWFAHLDVVPGTPEQFRLRLEGDRAFGRGVKDMKGATLPFLMAYRDALQQNIAPRISLLLTTDEETAGQTIPELLSSGAIETPAAFTPDTGSSPGIVTEHKGVVWAELTAHGSGGHGAMPWRGENPAWQLAEALIVLRKSFPPGTEDDWQITVSPTMLRGSAARNQIPDTASCGIDIRYPPSVCSSAADALAVVSASLPDGCELTEVLSGSPLYTDPQHHMVRLVQSIAQDVEGRQVETIREHGGTDARYFAEKGIPAFLYGPVGGDLHGANEWVSVPSLLHQYEISRRLIRKLSA